MSKPFLTYNEQIEKLEVEKNLTIYDHDFAVSMLQQIGYNKDSYCFDLFEIINKPHFHHNPSMENQMRDIIDEIITNYHNTPTIALTETLAEYTVHIVSIYISFLEVVEGDLLQSYSNFNKIVSDYPNNIITNSREWSGLFVYDEVDNILQVVHPKQDSTEMIDKYKKEANEKLKMFENDYNSLMSANLFISNNDGQISVESGETFIKKMID